MSYNPAIPIDTDTTLKSQSQIRANFQAINNVFSNNHYQLTGDPEFQGMHRVLKMMPQSGDAVTDADHVALYNKIVGSAPSLFFRPISNGTPIQLTYSSISTKAEDNRNYSFMAGPCVVYFGLIPTSTSGQVVTLSPTKTLVYVGTTAANLTTIEGDCRNTAININSPAGTFTISHPAITNLDIYYMAVGV